MSVQMVWLVVGGMVFSFAVLVLIIVFVSNEKEEVRKAEEKLRKDQLEMVKLKTFHETGRR